MFLFVCPSYIGKKVKDIQVLNARLCEDQFKKFLLCYAMRVIMYFICCAVVAKSERSYLQ